MMDEDKAKQLSIQAQMEQGAAAMCGMATIYGDYYKSLVKAGFTESQALTIVIEAQQTLLSLGRK